MVGYCVVVNLGAVKSLFESVRRVLYCLSANRVAP